MKSKTVTIDRKWLKKALDTITEMHSTQMSAWTGPMEVQRQLLLALGENPEKWAEKHYG